MNVLAWLVIGLVAGALARLLVPGRDPMGFVATLLLGLVGALVGGFLAQALFEDSDGVGLFGSTVGAVIVLLLWNATVARNRRGFRGMGRRAMS
jgi:uncharacterized membrane protein YeaQ/YmgE (transglycosylase-associated protein family)